MWPNSGPLALESDALPTALHGPATGSRKQNKKIYVAHLIYRQYLYINTDMRRERISLAFGSTDKLLILQIGFSFCNP